MRRMLLGLAVVLTATLSAGAAGCNREDRPAPDVAPTPTATAGVAISQAKSDYTDALKQAKDWQENATLARVYRVFEGTLNPTQPKLTFGFASLADPKNSYEVVFEGDDVTARRAGKRPFELAFNPIDVSQWEIDPDSALQTAENEGGGKDFRERHLAGYVLLQQLATSAGHPLQWYFRYDTGDGSNLRYEVYVNATTGVVDLKREIAR